ncbi:uncharacterized protein LOC129742765 [Uranotaenia lowii]|uniref:uncharacterized protein LOC129742765 n=1 Tax=Uranotaenia lowii TaxID=190385 RepID=UPI002478A90D|nr:uncharacterized protein LOC129742765 [Uranotaenia lowii]
MRTSSSRIQFPIHHRSNPQIHPDSAKSTGPPAPGRKYAVIDSSSPRGGICISRDPRSYSAPDTAEPINVYYQNVGGVNSCLVDYLLATSCSCYEFIALTETWLNDRTLSSQIIGPDYVVFRCDRSPLNSKKSTGGGVLLAVKSRFTAQLIEDSSWNDLELLWARIDLGDRKLYLCVVYVPPDRSTDLVVAESFSHCLSKISSICSPEDDILVIGDFNMPGLKWCPSHGAFLFPDPMRSYFSAPSNIFLDSLRTATLRQINSFENENGRTLDLCFINEGFRNPTIDLAPAPLVKVVSHHPALVVSIDVTDINAPVEETASFYQDFKNVDYEAISLVLDSIEWENELDLSNPNAAAATFSNILNYIIDRHVPKRSLPSNPRAPWVTNQLRQLKTAKNRALRYFSKHKSLCTKEEYRKLNTAYKKSSRRCYQNYLHRLQRNFKTNPRSFWKYVKNQRKEFGLPSKMFLKDHTANTDSEICNLFAEKFSSVFSTGSISSEQLDTAVRNISPLDSSLSRISFDDAAILKATAKLKNSSSTGPDGIPAIFLKRFMPHLLTPIRHIFRASLDFAIFPSLWKEAYMFPVHKKGDKKDIDNYRGISALCSIAKLFELIAPALFSHGNIAPWTRTASKRPTRQHRHENIGRSDSETAKQQRTKLSVALTDHTGEGPRTE